MAANSFSSRRDQRDAELDQAFIGKKYAIVAKICLPPDVPKFKAWISGRPGHNGFKIIDLKTGATHVTGKQTVQDAIARGAIVNPEALNSLSLQALA